MAVSKDIIIIGAGFGGLSAAAYLARAGHNVTVLEKNDRPGGRAMVFSARGYVFDQGPSWYLMPDVFDEFFADFEKVTSDYYELETLEPSYKVFEKDDSYNVTTAPSVFTLFEKLEPGSTKSITRLLEKTKSEYDAVRAGLLINSQLSPLSLLREPKVRKLLKNTELVRSYHSRISKYAKTDKLQHILEFMTVFLGGSPGNVPAMYSLLTHVDLGLGVRYPAGGIGSVVSAFVRLVQEQGARIRYESPVARITTHNGKTTGVILENGTELPADIVVANADYHHVETTMLGSKDRTYDETYWRKKTVSPSGLLIYLGVNKKIPSLQHHNLFFDTDWDHHFREVFNRKKWSSEPLFYVCMPSRSDKTVAPKGKENLFVLAPMASGVQPTQTEIDTTVKSILRRIERHSGTVFQDKIEVQEVRTQAYFEEAFNAYQGNAFGLAHTLSQSGPLRPRMKSKKVAGLYYVGQYTNPGTGVPLVVLSGKAVSNLIQTHE